MKFHFNLLKINISILKSLEKDERNLLQKAKCLNKDTEYKEYLSFILNNFTLNLDLKENLYLESNIKIFNFFLIDSDFYWKLNERGNIEECTVLNNEFSVNYVF